MICRGCNGSDIFDAIDLGKLPIAGGFLKTENTEFSLVETKLVVCRDCGLGQTSVDLDPKELFVEYNWRTSTSSSYVEYSKVYADYIIDKYSISSDNWVLEIASNDGYMLKHFKDKGIGVLGVDPAKNISMYAITDGIPVIADFFNSELASFILKQKGYPKLIVANNVMAHVPDIQHFIYGISILCNEDTIVTVENPTIMNILQKDHFDTIFHEHYSYLSSYAVNKLCKQVGLVLFDVESTNVHGGTNRYFIGKNKTPSINVLESIDYEINNGLLNQPSWEITFNRIKEKVNRFSNKVNDLVNNNKKVCGYTASAKSTILLNFAKLKNSQIISIADDVLEKQNHFIPGTGIKIVSAQEMLDNSPDSIVVFSWNIYEEIKSKIEKMGYPNIDVWIWSE